MKTKHKLLVSGFVSLVVLALIVGAAQQGSMPLLDPKGWVADEQKSLLVFGTLLSLVIVVPVFAITFAIVWRYREGNTKAMYTPDVDGNRIAETIWWGVPIFLILILSVVIWTSSHKLDPYRALDSPVEPVKVQVIALDWKWLFIYPDLGIASVNYLQIPVDTPVNFQITSDAPMNSFWVPNLGGQVYAMAGMTTKLHLIADEPGAYRGVSANISGEGFAGMKFIVQAASASDYDTWVSSVQSSNDTLTSDAYEQLAKQSKNNPQKVYAGVAEDLFDTVVMGYMMPEGDMGDEHSMMGHH